MKARSRRVGLPAIRNIGISVRDAVRKILSSGKTRLKTKLLKLELGIETRLTLKITTLSFPRRNLEIAIPVLSYNVRRNELHVRFLDGEREQQSRYNGSSRVVTRFYDSFNRTVSLIK